MNLFAKSIKEFAELVGYSVRQIAAWLDQGMPCERSGKKGDRVKIHIPSAIQWMLKNARTGRSASDDRERLAGAQADKVEFENQVRRGEFIAIERHGELLRGMVAEVAGQMAGFPGRVAGKVAGLKDPALVRSRLIDECNEVRNAVAAHLDGIAESIEGSGDGISPRGNDGAGAGKDNA